MKVIEGWEKKAIGDFAKTVSGGTPATHIPSYWQNGTIAWLNSGELSKHDFIREPSTLITENAVKFSAAKLVPKGSVGIALTGATTGMVGFFEIDTTTNQSITAILPNPTVDTLYLFYVLKNSRKRILGFNIGSAQPHINKQIVDELLVEFPTSKPEQTKIAEILSTVDWVIEQTEALIAKQQRIKTGLMHDLLTRGIDEHGNRRSEQTHEFKDSPLGRIPVEWEVKRIEELLADIDPAMRSGPFGSTLLKEELVDSGIPLLGIDNVFPEEFVPTYTRFVPPKKAQQLKRYRVRPRDIMITIMGTVGRCCVVPDDIGEALSSKHVWTISLSPDRYSPYLACTQINHSSWVLDHFARDEQGGIMAAIKSDTLRSTQLPVPPLGEMEMIEARLIAISTDTAAKRKILRKLRSLKTALMQDLLTGKKRVTALLNDTEEQSYE